MTTSTNLTDRLGELIEYADDRVEGMILLAFLVLNHKDEILSALRKAEQPAIGSECPLSPTGYHIVDTSMESGPNNCFHCEKPMRTPAARLSLGDEK